MCRFALENCFETIFHELQMIWNNYSSASIITHCRTEHDYVEQTSAQPSLHQGKLLDVLEITVINTSCDVIMNLW